MVRPLRRIVNHPVPVISTTSSHVTIAPSPLQHAIGKRSSGAMMLTRPPVPTRQRLCFPRPSPQAIQLRYKLPALALLVTLVAIFPHKCLSQPSDKPVGNASAPAPSPWDQNPNGMHIYIWAGLKSHQSGQHDYPQFLADWSKLLTERGAIVDGALHAPSAADLEHTDVVVLYKGDAGYLGETEKNLLEAYIKHGGGLVSLHDSLCGPDPAYFARLVGGAKKHGEVNYTLGAPIPYTIVDTASPIMQGMSNFTLFDEAFYNVTWAPGSGQDSAVQSPAIANSAVHILATAVIPGTPSAGAHKGEVVPQIWTYEHTLAGGQQARAFVWMQGHEYANFSNYQIQRMLLRGIAWAAQKPVEELVDYIPPQPSRMQPTTPNK
jgi:type 1 glutamine amidotransferase